MNNYKQILSHPILSEKSSNLSATLNKYVFKVEKNANKLEIKSAIESRFNVKVAKVSTMNVRGKLKNMTIKSNGNVIRTSGNRSSWKKAIITLAEGDSIDLLTGEMQ